MNGTLRFNVNWRLLASVLVPATLIVAVCVYVLCFQLNTPTQLTVLPGRALATYEDLYPIRVDNLGRLYLDRDRFVKAVDYFEENPSPRAVADLLYMGNSNNVTMLMTGVEKLKYMNLAERPDYAPVSELDQERDRVLQTYRDIVNAIGMTFAGTPMEIVLHDTRNPLRSIVAVQNTISGRHIGDTNTNFGLQLIKNYSYGEGAGCGRGNAGSSFISYEITLGDGRPVKATTIPIFHRVYGLIGFICINIDQSKLNKGQEPDINRFVDAFKATMPNSVVSEMIQHSRE